MHASAKAGQRVDLLLGNDIYLQFVLFAIFQSRFSALLELADIVVSQDIGHLLNLNLRGRSSRGANSVDLEDRLAEN
jgi:hypothetical protein